MVNFGKEQIYNWTYIDEQRAKKQELDYGNDSGDHTNLPDLRLFTYKMSDMITNRIDSGVDLGDEENYDYAFELNEMFLTDPNGRFYHEKEILTFLDQLTTNEKYPFSTPELRNELKHTFWLVGNRVASAKAMEKLLRNHPVFKDYKIILAAGNGRPNSDDDTSEMEMQDFKASEKAYDRVKKAIHDYEKTITLSVGQLTTGVTIEEWSAVLMLSDIKSESLYMQAIFRSQNPHKFTDKNGETFRKKSAYVFDFSPARVLRVYDKFANSLIAEAVNGEITDSQRKQNIAELLNYFPVLAEDKDGEMIELDAEQVLTFPKAIIAKEVVNRGFVTNLLFVNINNVFNIPSEIIDSLNKAQSTNDTGKQMVKAEDVEHDSERAKKRDHRISVNKEKLLGNKVYGSKMREIVANAVEYTPKEELANKIVEKYEEQIEEPLAAYKEIYSPSKAEFEELKNEQIEKVKLIADEYVAKDFASNEQLQLDLADKLSEMIENDLPNDLVTHKEEEIYEAEEETEMDQIRKKLRTFTRAIPSFIMASANPNAITLDNIEDTVSDEDFEQLFTEKDSKEPFTKEDFRKIRGPWTNPETGEEFPGFFDRYTFNAAIKEFEEKRQELADYLRPGVKEDIFSYIRPLKTNQIFTPRRIVNKMLDLLDEQNPGIFENPNITFADLYVKSGLYLTEIAKRLNRGLENKIPNRDERMKHIFEHQLYGFAPTEIIYNIAHKYVYGNFSNINTGNFKHIDLTDAFKKGDTLGMKFDVVVGNPPYQGDNHWQIYPDFYLAAREISDCACLIFPTGWQEPKNANNLSKLNTVDIKEDRQIIFIDNRHNVFDKITGAEWTNIILWKRGYDNGLDGSQKVYTDGENPIDIKLVTKKEDRELDPVLDTILQKVRKHDFRSICDIIYIQNNLNLDILYEDYPLAKDRIGSEGRDRRLEKNIFDKLLIFTDDKKHPDDINVVGTIKNKRLWKYTDRKYIDDSHPLLDKYKLIVSTASDSNFGGRLSDFIIGKPSVAYTRSFIGFGPMNSENEVDSISKYLKTKFARALLYTLKTTQMNNKDVWANIPLQSFDTNLDIDWSKPIAEIDKQLYAKYGLSWEEIDFIEEKVKAME